MYHRQLVAFFFFFLNLTVKKAVSEGRFLFVLACKSLSHWWVFSPCNSCIHMLCCFRSITQITNIFGLLLQKKTTKRRWSCSFKSANIKLLQYSFRRLADCFSSNQSCCCTSNTAKDGKIKTWGTGKGPFLVFSQHLSFFLSRGRLIKPNLCSFSLQPLF